jgi:hypothetical protein
MKRPEVPHRVPPVNAVRDVHEFVCHDAVALRWPVLLEVRQRRRHIHFELSNIPVGVGIPEIGRRHLHDPQDVHPSLDGGLFLPEEVVEDVVPSFPHQAATVRGFDGTGVLHGGQSWGNPVRGQSTQEVRAVINALLCPWPQLEVRGLLAAIVVRLLDGVVCPAQESGT